MGTPAGALITTLAARHRVMVIGGLAVIAHGFNRPTMDADLWLDPMDSPDAWATALSRACEGFPGLTFHAPPDWRPIRASEIARVADEIGMIRVQGLDCPVDVFRRPNEFAEAGFDEVYERGMAHADGTRLPDPLDLIITKLDTGRAKDLDDSRHLEHVIRSRYGKLLPTASLDEVKALFERFLDWEVCRMALENPAPAVRDHALACLRELAAEGDPFSQALLEGRELPYSQGRVRPSPAPSGDRGPDAP